jgi:hypothetical protein
MTSGQRAVAANRLARLERGVNKDTQACVSSQEEAAQLFDVGHRTVQMARAIEDGSSCAPSAGGGELLKEMADSGERHDGKGRKSERSHGATVNLNDQASGQELARSAPAGGRGGHTTTSPLSS